MSLSCEVRAQLLADAVLEYFISGNCKTLIEGVRDGWNEAVKQAGMDATEYAAFLERNWDLIERLSELVFPAVVILVNCALDYQRERDVRGFGLPPLKQQENRQAVLEILDRLFSSESALRALQNGDAEKFKRGAIALQGIGLFCGASPEQMTRWMNVLKAV